MRPGAGLFAMCVIGLLSAGPAGAATVSAEYSRSIAENKGSRDIWRVVYTAEPGEVNRPTITAEGGSVRVVDASAPLTPGPACRADGAGVVCAAATGRSAEIDEALIGLGDGDDSATVSGLAGSLDAGPGADRIDAGLTVDGGPGPDRFERAGGIVYAGRTTGVRVTPDGVADDGEPGEGDDVAGPYYEVVGGAGADELHGSGSFARIDGGPGDDRIVGTPGQDALGGGDGDDAIDAGDGTDLLTGGTGADVLRGGEGHDTVRYRATAEPLTVALDDAGGDGAPGEGDDVRGDVEDVDAGETRGDNVLIGSGAANLLQGGDGDDRLEGGAGDDTLRADDGANSLVGGPGVDLLDAYDFSSRRVADDIDARDGERDRIACGANGADRLLADPEDAAFGCAPVVVPAWAKYVRVTRRGVARLRVRCPATATAPCTGRLSLFGEAFIPRAGKGDFRGIAPGRIAAVGVRLTTATRRRLARVRTLQFDITALARRTRPKSTGEGYFRVRLLRHR